MDIGDLYCIQTAVPRIGTYYWRLKKFVQPNDCVFKMIQKSEFIFKTLYFCSTVRVDRVNQIKGSVQWVLHFPLWSYWLNHNTSWQLTQALWEHQINLLRSSASAMKNMQQECMCLFYFGEVACAFTRPVAHVESCTNVMALCSDLLHELYFNVSLVGVELLHTYVLNGLKVPLWYTCTYIFDV